MGYSNKMTPKSFIHAAALTIIVGLGAMMASAVRAEQFAFSYSFPTYDTADFPSGYTSASGLIDAVNEGGGIFLATSISGTWNGEKITALLPVGIPGSIQDNLLFPGSYPLVDTSGIDFSVSGPIKGDRGNGYVLIYFQPGIGYTDAGDPTGFSSDFNLTPTGAIPEPSAWALLIAGFGILGGSIRSRKTQSVAKG